MNEEEIRKAVKVLNGIDVSPLNPEDFYVEFPSKEAYEEFCKANGIK